MVVRDESQSPSFVQNCWVSLSLLRHPLQAASAAQDTHATLLWAGFLGTRMLGLGFQSPGLCSGLQLRDRLTPQHSRDIGVSVFLSGIKMSLVGIPT